jgi:YVTN family beta-propeller protein
MPISHRDRVYAAEQFSNTLSVIDPASNKLLGVIRLGNPIPANLSPLYIGQLLVHGMGFSPDHRTLAVVAIGSNAVNFIDAATNTVKHVTYVGRSPHEAFFTPDSSKAWVTVRGENYVSVLDGTTYVEKAGITVPNGPGMTIFSPNGKYGYVCSSFTPETVVIAVATHTIVGRVPQASPFCPNIAAMPDGTQVWFTLKDTGKVQVFDARPPFKLLKTLDTGPITNHVNFAHNANGTFAYVTIGGLNEVKVFRTSDVTLVATISVGNLPHGIWPSGDGTRVYVGLENADGMTAIDTLTNTVIATVPIGQGAQAVVYVPDAVPSGDGTQGLQPLGLAGEAAHLTLVSARGRRRRRKAADKRVVVRSGTRASFGGRCDGTRAAQTIRPRAFAPGGWPWGFGTPICIHDKSGWSGNRERGRTNSTIGARRGPLAASLFSDCLWNGSPTRSSRADPGALRPVRMKRRGVNSIARGAPAID